MAEIKKSSHQLGKMAACSTVQKSGENKALWDDSHDPTTCESEFSFLKIHRFIDGCAFLCFPQKKHQTVFFGFRLYMGVSKNKGNPKSSILIVFSIINHPFWGTIICGNTHMCIYVYTPVWNKPKKNGKTSNPMATKSPEVNSERPGEAPLDTEKSPTNGPFLN